MSLSIFTINLRHVITFSLRSGPFKKLKNPSKEDIVELTETLFKLYIENVDTYTVVDDMIEFMDEDVDTRDEETDEYKQAHDRVMQLPAYKMMLITLQNEINGVEPLAWNGEYQPGNGQVMQRFYYILERWDWNTTKEEMELMNGTAEYYRHGDDEDDE